MKTENISAVSDSAIKITGLGKWDASVQYNCHTLMISSNMDHYDLSTNKFILHIRYTDDDYDDVQMNRSSVVSATYRCDLWWTDLYRELPWQLSRCQFQAVSV